MKQIQILLISGAMAVASLANADELLSKNHYGNELDRCVAQLRADLSIAADTELEHTVTAIEKNDAWYEFTIETSGANQTVTSACQANRFNQATRIAFELTNPASTDGAQLAHVE